MAMKSYSAEFKADAVASYHSRPEATLRSAAEDLGVNPETLRHWIRLADGRRSGVGAGGSGLGGSVGGTGPDWTGQVPQWSLPRSDGLTLLNSLLASPPT
jgi:hypothetical protein